MSEEKNIEERPEDGKIGSPEEIHENETVNSQSSMVNAEPKTIKYKPETENMEVHHHPEVEKKGFKEYLLEGLMIFLAVTMGFIAENIREYFTDSQKEKQYIQSLCEDLKSDTARLDHLVKWDEEKIGALNNMTACYDTVSKNLKATSCMGLLIKYSKTNRNFQLTDRTLRQLGNAGGFRLLEKKDADSILAYEGIFRQYANFESTIFQGAQDNVRNTLDLLADFKVNAPLQNYSSLQGIDTSKGILQGPLLFSDDRVLLNKWFNELLLYLRVTNAQRNILGELKFKATNLIAYYKKKHNLP
jgi:hypothetical protein